ncbi:putative membrane protein YkoI [Luteibacter sp. Sphag1AF]|uniref:PepSY domain-containing protein n=1 Tax=Luteibacter sp. Sphag1AF TaxID=2587031 RepID=UPI00161299AB|nr:PepSY domain-containing protein [Luteibacter sp. Sphag1AF]MBB3225928.1 putative membrane protein YkoI [Luteibacter sp. Sphag1AF]
MKITFRPLFFAALLLAGASAWAGSDQALTLEQAVSKVQKDTGGKVLSADTRLVERGRITEYRVKVLTLDGHVRVVPIRSETAKIPDSTDRDTKEKH